MFCNVTLQKYHCNKFDFERCLSGVILGKKLCSLTFFQTGSLLKIYSSKVYEIFFNCLMVAFK